MEIWKDIKNYEGLYQVSNLGNVRSLNFHRQKLIKKLKFSENFKGYLRVDLYKNGRNQTYSVHKLVAETFIPNPENKSQINHKNAIKTDNRVENLEWNTPSENIQHSWNNGLQKGTTRKIKQYDLEGNFIKEWKSQKEASKKLKINQGNISACCLGIKKTAGGYIWRYKKEET